MLENTNSSETAARKPVDIPCQYEINGIYDAALA